MGIAFGKKPGGIQGAALLDNTVNQEVIFAPEQHDVATADIFDGNLPDQGNIPRPNPRQHARAVNAQGDAATPLQSAGNAQCIVGAAFTGDPTRLRSVLSSILHQSIPLKPVFSLL
jgi:hypothetical protein